MAVTALLLLWPLTFSWVPVGSPWAGSTTFVSPRRAPVVRLNAYPSGVYDPAAARRFFLSRPLEVAARAAVLVGRSAGFGLALLSDVASGRVAEREDERAAELAKLLTVLGPTFIKAGQSASIRTDLLPASYIRGLTALQDQVPPFSSDEARAIIADELGGTVPFATLSPEPVAAASLGQVYRGTLANGTEVAVKVQRPSVERQIALDMLLIREVGARVASAVGVPGDLIGTADAWGSGFVDELDYAAEAANAERFNADLESSSLSGRVFAPAVVREMSRRRVLTTVWVDGERLDRCAAPDDVPRLCSVAMNTYLESKRVQYARCMHAACTPHARRMHTACRRHACMTAVVCDSTIPNPHQPTCMLLPCPPSRPTAHSHSPPSDCVSPLPPAPVSPPSCPNQ